MAKAQWRLLLKDNSLIPVLSRARGRFPPARPLWNPCRGGCSRNPQRTVGPIVPPASSGGPGPRPSASTPEHTPFHEEGTCAAKTEPLCGDIETTGFLLTPGKTGQKNTRFQKLRASCLHAESGGRRVAEGARGWGRRAAATSLVRSRPMACAPGPPAEFPQCPPSCADGVESLGPRAGVRAAGRWERSGRRVGVRPAGG